MKKYRVSRAVVDSYAGALHAQLTAFAPSLLMLSACSGAADGEHTNPGDPIGSAQLAFTFPEQVTGLSDDAFPPGSPTSTAKQSETELNFSKVNNPILPNSVIQIVAYNDWTDYTDVTPAPPFDYTTANSLAGWSFSINGGAWKHQKLEPPTGYANLHGDPSVTSQPNAQHLVYYSTLGVPESSIPRGGTTDPRALVRDACVFRSGDGGITFGLPQCLVPPSGTYDGGSLGAGGPANNAVTVAAYLRFHEGLFVQLFNRIDLYRATTTQSQFVLQTGTRRPFGDAIGAGHPKVAVDPATGAVAIVALVFEDFQWKLRYNAAPNFAPPNNGAFLTSQVVAEGMPIQGGNFDDIVLADGTRIRMGAEYDVAIGTNEAGQREARVVYAKRNPNDNNRMHVYGARCTMIAPLSCTPVTLASGNCASGTCWDTEQLSGQHQEFHPRIAYANGKWVVSYYLSLDSIASPALISVVAQRFTGVSRATYSTQFAGIGGPVDPCPTSSGYWTDYDDIKFNPNENNASQGNFVTTFTDGGCPNFHVREATVPNSLWP